MSKAPQKPRGTQDMIGEAAARFDHVIETFNRVRKLHGFGRVEVPVFESEAVFRRSLGETTDVVSKEMYEFQDRNGDLFVLRPEFTAGICRAFIENGWQQFAPLKLATWGPLFRYERPQKGRFRQFHQLDAEILGAADAAADVEVISLGRHLLEELGIADSIVLNLNSMGDAQTREDWSHAVADYFTRYRGELSDDSQRRLASNPLRILDSKDTRDQVLVADAPQIDEYFTVEAGAFFEILQKGLQERRIVWTRNSRLVRGLDYYRHSVFEFITESLGAQGTVLGGGRYDGLIGHMGGPETPAVGWAAGVERLAMMLEGTGKPLRSAALVVEGDTPKLQKLGLDFSNLIRSEGMPVTVFNTGNPRKRFEKAQKSSDDYIISLSQDLNSSEVMFYLKRNIRDRFRTRGRIYVALASTMEKRFGVPKQIFKEVTKKGGRYLLIDQHAKYSTD